MNKKGFTLIELIAMMVVLGVLMAIAIPNITGILKSNRESIAEEDIHKMVSNAKVKFETGDAKYPKLNECAVMTLKFIDNNNDFTTGVNGGTYDQMESVIIVKKEQLSEGSNTYKYYIRLVEVADGKYYVVGIIGYDEFTEKPEEYVPRLTNFTDNYRLQISTNDKDTIKYNINSLSTNLCNSISGVYT